MSAGFKDLSEKVFQLKYDHPDIFWEETSSRGKMTLTLNSVKLLAFLKKRGFVMIDQEVVRITRNIAERVTPRNVFNYCRKYIEEFKDELLENLFLNQGENLLLKKQAILISLPEQEPNDLLDTEKTSFHYYSNGILKIESDSGFSIIPYEELQGFVWKEEVLKRNFKIFKDEVMEQGMFYQFVQNITNDERHFKSLCSALGYLIHKYKDPRKPICVIFNDENLTDDGKPQGGTGKGILIQAISQIVEKISLNGKNSNFSANQFIFQAVNDTTRILAIEDPLQNFQLESLFSVLTDGIPVEKKFRGVVGIPFRRSPKFVITTNYTIRGSSSSFVRRRFDVYLNHHYNANRTPGDEFGCEFFHGWNEDEWELFDFFMMSCLKLYLSTGFIPYDYRDLLKKKLENETSIDFVELMEEQFTVENKIFHYKEVREALVSEYGEKYRFLKDDNKKVVQWVKLYSEFKNLNLIRHRGTSGNYFIIKMN